MSKKKRVFDIDFEEVDVTKEATVPAGTERRGPMAAAITENAEALNARQSAEAAIRQENDALAHEHVRLKKAGLITDLVPLDAIRTDKLVRDRAPGRDPEIDELKQSIKEIGLSNPIRVEQVGDVFELIQGFRRFTAYAELFEETGDEAFARIPAGINAKGENLLRLYRRMVDENLVRRGVSFGEMAQLAINYRKQASDIEGYDHAVELLFASSGRQKRSYIKHFVRLLSATEGRIRHVDAIPRALGLQLVRRLDEDADAGSMLNRMLGAEEGRTAEQEQALLSDFAARYAAPAAKKVSLTPKARAAKTTFRLNRPGGDAKCTVADGRIELRLEQDFSGVERKKLEAAVEAFLKALD
ncbi:Replication protein [Sulfitobacter noctilucicola]|uniref:ParB family chromosome partitioning protein n=1 Tax=Sulfitobacter noctilucicola TaxID=1342301 RepID=A0A7W6Q7P4_9RHOB|nr:ParB N-terminal domain-containing protein [Sulfitobacter noctilucicola]KIN70052.1 Replication protein [Sulfitobacter noctilucicola]MBB4176065.1 ParB family chromosome partitioning protein [Sulfitobacter noctilucicola]